MEYKEFEEITKQELQGLGVTLKEEQLKKLYQYMYIVKEWNEKINLTAIVEEKEMIIKHFIDSLTIYNEIQGEDYVLDIGTGAGFPGIPLKIAKEDVEMVLMDSLQKRIHFLNTEVITPLGLQNIQAVHGRAEESARKTEYRESFDVVVSRAVAALPTLVEYMLPFVKVGGKCICMKGPKLEEELQQAEKAIQLLGGNIEKIESLEIGEEKNSRNIIIIRKEKITPKQFPRKAGTPAKNPIE